MNESNIVVNHAMYIENSSTEDLKFYRKLRAKANSNKLCDCPYSELGKVKIDPDEHLQGCRFYKRSRSSKFGTKRLVIPDQIRDGCSLGIVL
jgi:hypothetical protein